MIENSVVPEEATLPTPIDEVTHENSVSPESEPNPSRDSSAKMYEAFERIVGSTDDTTAK